MRLAAIFILKHDFIFDSPQLINFGGKLLFDFVLKNEKIYFKSKINDLFIDDFYGTELYNISALVGANGTGKTTLLSIINKDAYDVKTIFIYYDENDLSKVSFINKTGELDKAGYNSKTNSLTILYNEIELTYNNQDLDIPSLYYSPILDYDLKSIRSQISKTHFFNSTLEEFHINNIERNILLMNNKTFFDNIKKVFPAFPEYNTLFISGSSIYKREFRNIYSGYNKEESDDSKSMKISLDLIWDSYDSNNTSSFTHNKNDFIKDLEVNIFSNLALDGTSALTSFNGIYETNFRNIVDIESFEDKLKEFFFHKICFIDYYTYEVIKDKFKNNNYLYLIDLINDLDYNETINKFEKIILGGISKTFSRIDDLKENKEFIFKGIEQVKKILESENEKFNENPYINIIDNLNKFLFHIESIPLLDKKQINSFQYTIINGIKKSFEALQEERNDFKKQLLEKIKHSIKLFGSIQDFHNYSKEFRNRYFQKNTRGELLIDLKNKDSIVDFQKYMERYKDLIVIFNRNQLIDCKLLDFKTSKKLSFGEKAILEFASSFYSFTLRPDNYLRRKEYYIILLDEADLGFHPEWKRLYIQSMKAIISSIFKELNSTIKYQIILTTHDPISLSDIPRYSISYLNKNHKNFTEVKDFRNGNKKSFGANVHDLLADSFFLENGFMGKFAEQKIKELISYLNSESKILGELTQESSKKLIAIIDEPLIKERLESLWDKKFLAGDRIQLEKKIKKLQKQLKDIDEKNSDNR